VIQRLSIASWLLILGLSGSHWSLGQSIYFTTSSSSLPQNSINRVGASGGSQVTLLTATGSGANQLNRCAALAVDALNGKLFLIDGQSNAVWSVNLDGTGLALVRSGLTSFATDLALDVLHQEIYYTTSSTQPSGNTVQRMDYAGANNTTLLNGTGASGNGVSRCTAIALDAAHSRMFIADAGALTIWRMNLDGSGLVALVVAKNSFPMDLALDVTGQQVYFALSSTQQSSNQIMRVSYGGTGLTNLFTATGAVQRCTALDMDAKDGAICFSDAGAKAIWRLPLGGGSVTPVISGLSATVKKLRWYNGPQAPPPPGLVAINLSGQNVVLSATNGFAGVTYYVLTSTNVARPLNSWLPVSTNVLAGSGNFSITASNAFHPASPVQFYILQVR
jgi:hypothetical protein